MNLQSCFVDGAERNIIVMHPSHHPMCVWIFRGLFPLLMLNTQLQRVNLKVNSLTSSKTLFPIEYYKHPFCRPPWLPIYDNQNLGEFLAGDRIAASPYILNMKKDTYCQHLCASNLGRGEQPGVSPNRVVKKIRHGYHHNWIVDNLDAAYKSETFSESHDAK
jgi:hypothetical protein